MNAIGLTILLGAVSLVAASAGWVFRDALARGLPRRKALTWAALQGVEWPVFLLLYRRIRPRRRRGEQHQGPPLQGAGSIP